ncbi:MAG: cytidine deaminase [Bacteroidia bacterium]|nr:cytidine deaminase [Bacteroidia bacterium]
MTIHEIKISFKEYGALSELSRIEQKLVTKAENAAHKAYAPYSHFMVGAAILLENGEIIEGNNQENAAYPSGLCAERVAMFYANSKFPDIPIITIAISAFSKKGKVIEPVPPCGSCRQALLESEIRFKKPIKLILSGKKKIYIIENISSLLPLNFSNKMLE